MTGPKTNERPGTRAVLNDFGTSAYKVREVLKLIRDKDVATALNNLQFSNRGPAQPLRKLLVSAISNAVNNGAVDPNELYVSACFADEGRTMGRFRPRAKGRGSRIRKRTSHVTIIVSRLPEDRLATLRNSRDTTQADRAKRVAGGRKAASSSAAAESVEKDSSSSDTASKKTSTEATSTGATSAEATPAKKSTKKAASAEQVETSVEETTESENTNLIESQEGASDNTATADEAEGKK